MTSSIRPTTAGYFAASLSAGAGSAVSGTSQTEVPGFGTVPTGPAQGPDAAPPAEIKPSALLDVMKMIASPIETVKGLYHVTKDLLALQKQKGLTLQTAPAAYAQYQAAHERLEGTTFKRIFPFFGRRLENWALGRFNELTPQIQGTLSERAWHPVALEWPDAGTGHQRLGEAMLLVDVATRATDGQMVRGFQGLNRIRFQNSGFSDVYRPLASEWDAMVLRRPLRFVPGQASMADALWEHINRNTTVSTQIQNPPASPGATWGA